MEQVTYPSLLKIKKRWFPHFITERASQFANAIALKVIKYCNAGKQFPFYDDAKSQRKTKTN